MTQKIIITDTQSLKQLPTPLRDLDSFTWSYLGTDSILHCLLKPALSHVGNFVCLGQLFNEIAATIREDFLNFDSIIDYQDQVLWNTTHLAEKSPVSSTLFHNTCTVLTFNKYIEETEGNFLLVVDDWFIAFFLARHAKRKKGIEVSLNCLNQDFLEQSPFRALRTLRRQQTHEAQDSISRYQVSLQSRYQWVKDLRREAQQPLEKFPRSIDTLFVLWTTCQTFPSQLDAGKETYFGNLPSKLNQSSNTAYLINPIDWVEPLQSIYPTVLNSNHASNSLFLEDCVQPEKFKIQAQRTLRHHLRRSGNWELEGLKLNALMADSFYEEKARFAQGKSLQFYFVADFLAQNNIEVKRVIFPYENQPWEKALRLGFEKWMPETQLVGYFHNAGSKFWLSSYPGETNLENENIPHQIAVPGPYWHERLSKNGFSKHKLSIWPAFRHSFLHNFDPTTPQQTTSTSNDQITTLLALPIDLNSATELLLKSLAVFSKNKKYKLIARFHPKSTFGAELLTELLPITGLPHLPDNIQPSTGSLEEDLQESQIVIANGTSVEIQAMRQGIATLCLLSEHSLDMQMLPLKSYTYSARTTEDLEVILDEIARHDTQEGIAPWSNTTLNYYFRANTEENRKKALG